MDYLDTLAERRIAEAIERGELSGLPGEGRPLALDDDTLIPAELRTAYRMLKNAGFVPPEVESLREIGELERLIERSDDQAQRDRAARRLELIWQRLAIRSPAARVHARTYRDRLLAHLSGRRSDTGPGD